MAALHSALQTLAPTSFSSIPLDDSQLQTYLQDAFSRCQVLIDSVPPPPIDDSPAASIARSRSSTSASIASNASEISASSARSDPPIPAHAILQKEWGKPIKLSAKENPLGMAVYKLSGKDGKGAWFARRSVHEGLGFTKWKLGLQREFPESLKVQGGPGEGNIRGIGGERRVERKLLPGVGTMEVYHLSAQFPGPTTPRDFVTLLLTSSLALTDPSSQPSSPDPEERLKSSRFSSRPRHFMVISKPCDHPDCPPRDGFIRGQYESIEFIREVPLRPKKSSSTTDLLKPARAETAPAMNKEAIIRNAQKQAGSLEIPLQGGIESQLEGMTHEDGHLSPDSGLKPVSKSRARGRTISFAESRGEKAKGEAMDVRDIESDDEAEMNPVEWIMITRSDPGGSVPRFMVERGTPSSIVADAGKFLDWACKKEHLQEAHMEEGDVGSVKGEDDKTEDLEAYQTNGHLAGLDGSNDTPKASGAQPQEGILTGAPVPDQPQQGGLWSSVANAAYAGIGSYAPQAVIDRLPAHQQTPSSSTTVIHTQEGNVPDSTKQVVDDASSLSSTSSIASFASAEDHFDNDNIDDSLSMKSTSSPTIASQQKDASQHEKELAKLADRKRKLDEKLAKIRVKETKDKEDLTSKETQRLQKAQEKHAREIAKAEEKHSREVSKLEAKRAREAAKEEERRKKAEDKDEKARLVREKEEIKEELEVVRKERDILRNQVGDLQKENTALVAKMGKLDGGGGFLREVKAEIVGSRSRSSSLRRPKGNEGTVLEALTLKPGSKAESKPSSVKGD